MTTVLTLRPRGRALVLASALVCGVGLTACAASSLDSPVAAGLTEEPSTSIPRAPGGKPTRSAPPGKGPGKASGGTRSNPTTDGSPAPEETGTDSPTESPSDSPDEGPVALDGNIFFVLRTPGTTLDGEQTVTVTNTSDVARTIADVATSGAGYSVVKNRCAGVTLAPRSSCEVVVRVVATATATPPAGRIIVTLPGRIPQVGAALRAVLATVSERPPSAAPSGVVSAASSAAPSTRPSVTPPPPPTRTSAPTP